MIQKYLCQKLYVVSYAKIVFGGVCVRHYMYISTLHVLFQVLMLEIRWYIIQLHFQLWCKMVFFFYFPGECQWLHLDLIRSSISSCRQVFPVVCYAFTTIPSYPSGQIGFLLASNDKVTGNIYSIVWTCLMFCYPTLDCHTSCPGCSLFCIVLQ